MSFTSLLSCVGRVVNTAIFGSHHEMGHHAFTPSSYGPSRLYYQGDVPILEIQSDNPHEAGFAHGYLLGSALQQLIEQFDVLHLIDGMSAGSVARTIDQIRQKIPSEYLEEMKGIVEGVNKWRREHNWIDRREVTVHELILFHLMPDMCHFDPKEVEAASSSKPQGRQTSSAKKKKSPRKPLACTVVIDRDQDRGITFGRNLDWPSYGIGLLGTLSLVINRKYATQGRHSTAEVGFPGLVGTFTGMNDEGLSLAMNVCDGSTKQVRGIPAAFFNRLCLEQARRVDDLAVILKTQTPLGAFHLNVADKESAKAFHFYQGRGPCVERALVRGEPLITANSRYNASGKMIKGSGFDEERIDVVADLFQKAKKQKRKASTIAELVATSLTISPVNCDITMHKVVMFPKSKKMQVAFDNQYCGAVALREVDTKALFGHRSTVR